MLKKGKYRHFKGAEYEVIDTATHSETQEELGVYRDGEKKLWVRPLSMFHDLKEYGGKLVSRFEFVCPVEPAALPHQEHGGLLKKGRYRHFKGAEYQVIDTATHSETQEELGVYRALYGKKKLWVRPLSMFQDLKEHEGDLVPRFEYVCPVAYVPVHPVHGPLWVNTVQSLDQERPSYPVMSLYL